MRGIFPCLGDSGADRTTMSKTMAAKAKLVVRPLNEPIQVNLASSDHVVQISGEATTFVAINTKVNGKIYVRNVPIWIMDNEMDEVLLGDDVLKRLGISVKQLLVEKGGADIDYNDVDLMMAYPPLGGEDEEALKAILNARLDTINDPDFGPAEKEKWRKLLHGHVDVFRTGMGHDPPAKLPPYNAHWDKEKAKQVKPRRMAYTLEQKQHLEYFCDKLIEHGYAYENPNARYASEVIVVNKVPNPTDYKNHYRMVVNLKIANSCVESIQWPFPTAEDAQQQLAGSKYFITMDLKNGFWQIKLHEECQELFSFCTHRRTITPVRLIQGGIDSTPYFVWGIYETFKERMNKGILAHVDDLLLYAKTIEELFKLLEWTLQRALAANIKLSPKELDLFAQQQKWCGRIQQLKSIKL